MIDSRSAHPVLLDVLWKVVKNSNLVQEKSNRRCKFITNIEMRIIDYIAIVFKVMLQI